MLARFPDCSAPRVGGWVDSAHVRMRMWGHGVGEVPSSSWCSRQSRQVLPWPLPWPQPFVLTPQYRSPGYNLHTRALDFVFVITTSLRLMPYLFSHGLLFVMGVWCTGGWPNQQNWKHPPHGGCPRGQRGDPQVHGPLLSHRGHQLPERQCVLAPGGVPLCDDYNLWGSRGRMQCPQRLACCCCF